MMTKKRTKNPKPKGFIIGCRCPLADADAKLDELNRDETRNRVWKRDTATGRGRDAEAQGFAFLYAVEKKPEAPPKKDDKRAETSTSKTGGDSAEKKLETGGDGAEKKPETGGDGAQKKPGDKGSKKDAKGPGAPANDAKGGTAKTPRKAAKKTTK